MSTSDLHAPAEHEEPHADHRLITRLQDAIDAWMSQDGHCGVTSQITGGGAVAALEDLVSQMHGDRPAMLLPSGTYALRIALTASGVEAGDDVLVPSVDWPANWAAVASIGARPVPVAVDAETLTIDAQAAVAARTRRAKAVIACHLHGVPADVPAIRRALPGLPVIEDCAQALGSTLDGQLVGTLGDAAVLSFGPMKQVDAGEAGILIMPDVTTYRAAVRDAAHPVRQVLAGVLEPETATFSVRPHPVAAILGWHAFQLWDPEGARRSAQRLAGQLSQLRGVKALGHDPRRSNAGSGTPILLAPDRPPKLEGIVMRRTGARVLGWTNRRSLTELLSRTYITRAMTTEELRQGGWSGLDGADV